MTNSIAGSRPSRWCVALAIAAAAMLTFAAGANATIFRPTDGVSFRQAVLDANANAPSLDKIIMPSDAIIAPTQPITITDSLIITGDHSTQTSTGAPGLNGGSVVPLEADFITVGTTASPTTVLMQGFDFAQSSGGAFAAIKVNAGSTLRLDGMTLQTNNGQALNAPTGATAFVTNSLISDTGTLGIFSRGSLTLTNSTITNNFGGGVDARGTFVMRNTVLQNPDSSNCFAAPIAAQSGNNFSGDGFAGPDTSCGPTAATGDPQLDTFGVNGGPTITKAPLAGSPLINGGSNAFCPAADQRFFVRPTGVCDIGAIEVGGPRDTTAPSCVVTAVRRGGAAAADEQDVTLTDGGAGIGPDAVFSEEIALLPTTETTGTFSFTPKTAAFRSPASATPPSDGGLVVTAQKSGGGANNAQRMRWRFTARDWAGNVTDCR